MSIAETSKKIELKNSLETITETALGIEAIASILKRDGLARSMTGFGDPLSENERNGVCHALSALGDRLNADLLEFIID